ncbi:Pseudouridylate synthase, partial [Trachipleistophora hominis]
VYDIIKVPKSFNPKNRTDHRTYHYLLPQHIARLDSTALSSILALYTGTRNYHNFTQQSNTRGKSRHITNIRVERAHNGWYEIKITGQSFMMHQIRKMIGFVLLVINWGGEDGAVPAMERIRALFGCAFSERVLNVPKAPAHALFLDAPVFAGYNGRYENHRDLVVDEAEKAAVRERMIYKEIMTERCIRMFREWQECVEAHMYEYGYLKEVL